eukprot:471037_1
MTFTLICAMIAVQISYAVFPDILEHGTNIHFTSPTGGVPHQLSEAFNVVRMDFNWQSTEKTKGVYDFSSYDTLVSALESATPTKIRPYLILDYGNQLYDGGNAPTSPTAVQAFVNWVVAALNHFKGKHIIWELWNEPNLSYAWKPKPNATAYGVLANAVGSTIKSNSSSPIYNEIFIGPATSGIDTAFLETIFKMGVLKYFEAVSVHPYRKGGPENVLSDYKALKNLIDQYNPYKQQNVTIPIISGEWGWSTCYDKNTPVKCNGGASPDVNTYLDQANYLVRQWLINDIAGVPVSIFYDYKNDGTDNTAGEDNFGTVGYSYMNSTVPYAPKLSYIGAMTYQKLLGEFTSTNGFSSVEAHCNSKGCDDTLIYAVEVKTGKMPNVVVWYAEEKVGVNVDILVSANIGNSGCWNNVYDMFGNAMSKICTDGNQISIANVTDSPVYLTNFSVN